MHAFFDYSVKLLFDNDDLLAPLLTIGYFEILQTKSPQYMCLRSFDMHFDVPKSGCYDKV